MARSGGRRERASTEEAIIVAFFDIANHLARRGERLARQAGLTTQQWLVLLEIAGDPSFRKARGSGAAPEGILPSEIAQARGVSRATVSALVAQLLKLGLIRDVEDPEDGRRRRLQITPAGERALATIEPVRKEANRRLLAGLTPPERDALLRYLQATLAPLVEADRTDPVG
jgi:DNA-binding MarR family transcriptional regulator